jgi:hypothetical protein
LRETGNLKLVQKALNHSDIKSTLRYVHVLDKDIADAVERVAKSRTKSRTRVRKDHLMQQTSAFLKHAPELPELPRAKRARRRYTHSFNSLSAWRDRYAS